jgi:threonylcarbamoyladenosine tRNA methylthiotransferase MtaB
LASTQAVCEHLHVPLQSGSDPVLRAMGRAYTMAEYEGYIADARGAIPGLSVTTDLIAGFPGETDSDQAATLALVQRIGFAKLHVFRYSERRGTPAAEMVQLAPEIRAARAAQLRDAGDRMRALWVEARVGQVAHVLVEQVTDGVAVGTTRDYLRVRTPAPAARVGCLLDVRLSRVEGGQVLGEPVT